MMFPGKGGGNRPWDARKRSLLCRLYRQGDGFQRRQVELRRRAVDVDADDLAFRVQICVQTVGDNPRLHAGRGPKFDIEAVGLRIVNAASFRRSDEVTMKTEHAPLPQSPARPTN